MRDGVRLATDLYGVETGVRKPVLLLRTPYNKDGGASVARRFAAAGYVAVVQDARGAFASEGQYFHHNNDDQDGYDTIEWLSRQIWSNGKTGTWGGSHPGAVQWLAAADRPPGLVVIAPTAASASLYDTAYVGGALRLALIGGAGPLITKAPSGIEVPKDLVPFYRTAPLVELDRAIGWEMPWLRGILEHPWLDGFWSRQHATERTKGLDICAQHIVGYFDFLCRETVASFQRMRKYAATAHARESQQLILGPWDHGTGRPPIGSQLDFGPSAAVDVVDENLRWFNRYLKPASRLDAFPRVRYFVLGQNQWHTAGDWPPPSAVDTSFYLQENRSLKTAASRTQAGPAEFISDPSSPVPAEPGDGPLIPRSSMFRPVDRRAIRDRKDVLIYASAPRQRELIVAGNPRVELWISTDAEDADFAVKLNDLWPSGAAYPVAEGVLRLTHRNGDREAAAVRPGEVYKITVDLGHTAFSLGPGHSLQLEIAGSCFPVYDLNLHTGEGPFARSGKKAFQWIYQDRSRPSRVLLPVLR